LLLKLFSHPDASGHLRGFAEEFGDSTNSVRIELGKLQEAGLIESFADGQKVIYRPNSKNPFYLELTKLVSKYLGFDQLVERVLSQLGDLQAAYVIGDYANGLDTGVIEVALVGQVDRGYAESLAEKGENELRRKVRLAFLEDELSLENVSKLKLL
jgi:DNA-binding transcriptional ArsR family regulator